MSYIQYYIAGDFNNLICFIYTSFPIIKLKLIDDYKELINTSPLINLTGA